MNNLKIIEERKVFTKEFKIYGDFENLLFLAKDVAEWIEHSNPTEMIRTIDEDEKMNSTILSEGQNRVVTFLTEDGLYEVLMQNRKPIAKAFKKEVKKILKEIRLNSVYIPQGNKNLNTFTINGMKCFIKGQIADSLGMTRSGISDKAKRIGLKEGIDFIILEKDNLNKFKCENSEPKEIKGYSCITVFTENAKDRLSGNIENYDYTQEVLKFTENNRNKISYLNVIEN